VETETRQNHGTFTAKLHIDGNKEGTEKDVERKNPLMTCSILQMCYPEKNNQKPYHEGNPKVEKD